MIGRESQKNREKVARLNARQWFAHETWKILNSIPT